MIYEAQILLSSISPSRRREVVTGISAGPISDSVHGAALVHGVLTIRTYMYIHMIHENRKSLTKRLSPM